MEERLQKILSARGICSRRKAEEYIVQGLVLVNGVPAILGQKADPDVDTIEVDGSVIDARKEMKYYLLNKPVGVETSNVEKEGGRGMPFDRTQGKGEGGRTVRDLLPKNLQGKLFPVGRLDKDSSGLLIMTNDGVLAYRLTHPKFDHEKEYEVTVDGEIFDGALMKLEKGMMIDGAKTKPTTTRRLDKNRFLITLTEGRNRQIRRMCQKVGSPVIALKRVRIMTIRDDQLKEGGIRELTKDEVSELLKSIGV